MGGLLGEGLQLECLLVQDALVVQDLGLEVQMVQVLGAGFRVGLLGCGGCGFCVRGQGGWVRGDVGVLLGRAEGVLVGVV